MISAAGVNDRSAASSRALQEMKWGLIPSWATEDPKEFKFKTVNARVETILEKGIFKTALNKGRRCVVVADGFYEWYKDESSKGPKRPYFVYFPQNSSVDWMKPDAEGVQTDMRWTGRRLLTMAGLYNVTEKDGPLYSFTVLTVSSSKKFSWLHDRMPAILDGDDAVNQWLNSHDVTADEALKLLKPTDNITYHEVSSFVSDVRHKGPECLARAAPAPTVNSMKRTQKTLDAYFKPKRRAEEEPPVKLEHVLDEK